MEFHGTWSAPISLTRIVPWNSMELVVRQFRWQEQFHGIPSNFGCANFDDSSSSMEFHGIPWNLECANFADTRNFHGIPWNSMELGVRQFHWHEQFHGIPWNSMELKCANFAWREQFHRIPWNLECANFDDTSGSMEFLWTILMELANFADTRSSMEFHGTNNGKVSIEFHGTDTSSSMEFHVGVHQFRWQEQFFGISLTRAVEFYTILKLSALMIPMVPPISMTRAVPEFHGTWSASISLTRAVLSIGIPWNHGT